MLLMDYCWDIVEWRGDYFYLRVSLTPWAVSAAVLRDGGGGAVTSSTVWSPLITSSLLVETLSSGFISRLE